MTPATSTKFRPDEPHGIAGSIAAHAALPSRPIMTKPSQAAARIDKLMENASRALVETNYFDCESVCLEALELAHSVGDYERMARILMPLQEARRQIRLQAVDTGNLVILREPIPEGQEIDPGCYLIEPPLVGADARDLRDRASRRKTPVMVLAREPAVKSVKLDRRPGDWPVVMIGPVTLRAYVTPPDDGEVTHEWFQAASEALGDRAIAEVDSGIDVFARVEDLFERLHSVTDHEKLHQALEQACREAAAEPARPVAKGKNGPRGVEAEEALEDAA
ncbi:MAG: hypothetical protein ACKVZJ_15880 [Phycisphaerales bacterium]